MLQFYRQMAGILTREPVVLATVIHVRGSVPREVGARMVIRSNRTTIGTIGGGAGEAKVIQQSVQVLESGQKQQVEIDLTGAPQRETQGVCGGTMQVWLERWQGQSALTLVHQIIAWLESGQSGVLITPLEAGRSPHLEANPHPPPPTLHPHAFLAPLLPPPALLIIGAGHCAIPLAHIAHLAGFQIIVQDDRPEFATQARFPDAALVLAEPIRKAILRLPAFSALYVALVTRGFVHDLEALQALRRCSTNYIGMIGSERRVKMVLQTFQQSMEPQEWLAFPHIYAPIGLDIGALTPEEIAVSICAELIKVRRGGSGRSLSERLQSTQQPPSQQPANRLPSPFTHHVPQTT